MAEKLLGFPCKVLSSMPFLEDSRLLWASRITDRSLEWPRLLFQQWAPREAWGPPQGYGDHHPSGEHGFQGPWRRMLCADSGASRVPLAVFRWQETKEAGCGGSWQGEEVHQTPRFHREPPGPGRVWEGPAQMDKETESGGTKRLTQCKDKDAEAGRQQDCPRHPGLSFEPGPPDPPVHSFANWILEAPGKTGLLECYLLELLVKTDRATWEVGSFRVPSSPRRLQLGVWATLSRAAAPETVAMWEKQGPRQPRGGPWHNSALTRSKCAQTGQLGQSPAT